MLRKEIINAQNPDEVVDRYIRQRETKKTEVVNLVTVKNIEWMYAVDWEGIRWHYSEETRASVVKTISDLVRETKIPQSLKRHTNDVYFSTQPNKDDSFWEFFYQIPGFASYASARQQSVMVYSMNALDKGAMCHEMAHNLALWKYGNTVPPQWSDYYQALMQPNEPPVSQYATRHEQEDSAESVKEFILNPMRLRVHQPTRYNVIRRILEDAR
jgi:uncharacterized protein YjdB